MKTFMSALFAGLLGAMLTGYAPGPAASQERQVPPPEVGLHEAALRGDLAAVRRHIATGANLDAKDAFGSAPLIIAATFGRTEVARALIAGGADLDVRNAEGSTALHVAALLGHVPIVEALLAGGADRTAVNAVGVLARDLVTVPYEDLRAVYAKIAQGLAPLGLKLDEARIRAARSLIAQRLRPRPDDLAAIDYAPARRADWPVVTPAARGLDPRLLAELFLYAERVPTLYGLVVVKDGRLVAEKYFNAGGIDQLSGRQSATKSVVSAALGLALERGCLKSVDQKMLEFFPEFTDAVTDPRKRRVSIRDLLQMRAGYPWEGRTPPYFERLFLQENWYWLPHLVDFPLVADPGTAFGYSNLSSHLLAVIVARACGTDLQEFAQHHLFAPLGASVPRWTHSPDGHAWGWGEIYLTARDMAKFGQLYLEGGSFRGKRVLPARWVRDSLQRYSTDIYWTGGEASAAGLYFRDIGYGYQWWSARAGAHRFDYAWGHGGQLIVLLDALDLVIVTTADPLHHLPEDKGWHLERRILDLVGRYIAELPAPPRR